MARKYQVSLDLKSNIEKTLSKVEKSFKKAEKSLGGFGKAGSKISGITNKLKGAAALGNPWAVATAGVAALGAAALGAVSGAAALVQQLNIAEERTGIGAEKLSEWETILKQVSAGADLEDLQEAILNVSERFGEAAQDAGAIRDALNALGFDNQEILDLSQLGTAEEQFEAFANAVKDLPPAELTFRLREIGAEDLLRVQKLLPEIANEASAARQQIETFDTAFSAEGITKIREYNAQAKLTTAIFSDITKEFGARLAPTVSNILGVFTDFVDLVGGTDTIVAVLADTFNLILFPLNAAAGAIRAVFQLLNATIDIVVKLGGVIGKFIVEKFTEARQKVIDFITSIPGGERALRGLGVAADFAGKAVDKAFGNDDISKEIEKQAEAAEKLSGAQSSFRSFVSQQVENFGEVKINVKGDAEEKLQKLNADFATLKESVIDIKVNEILEIDPNISDDELFSKLGEAAEEFEKTFGASYQKAQASLQTFINNQVNEYDRLKSTYNELEKIQLQSEATIAGFRNKLLSQDITGPQLAELIALEENKTAELIQAYKDRISKTEATEAERLRKQAESTAKEAKAISDAKDQLLAEVNKFGEIDLALADSLSKIQDNFDSGGLSGVEASQLKLVAEVEAQLNRDNLDRELAQLESSARNISQIEVQARIGNADEFVTETSRILEQIEADRQQVEDNFAKTFKFDPTAAQELRDVLSADIDVAGTEALDELITNLQGLSIVPDIDLTNGLSDELNSIDGPIRELQQKLSDALSIGDDSTAKTLDIIINTIETEGFNQLIEGLAEGFKPTVELELIEPDTSILNLLDSSDAVFNTGPFIQGLREVESEILKTALKTQNIEFIEASKLSAQVAVAENVFRGLDAVAPDIDFDQIVSDEDYDVAVSKIEQFADLIENLKIEFPDLDFSRYDQSIADASAKAATSLAPDFNTVLSDVGGQIGKFASQTGGIFNEQNAQFNASLENYKQLEAKKTDFAAAQTALRQASNQTELDSATETLNGLLEKYGITNQDLVDLGLDRGASAQQIAKIIGKAAESETDIARKEAAKQEAQARRAFEVDKAFRLANATIAGIEAVQNAYAFGSKYGGPVGGAIAAGIAGIFSLKQIQAISSTSFGGSGGALSSGASGGGGSFDADSVATANASNANNFESANDSITSGRANVKSNIEINFQGRSNISTDEARDMVNAIKDAAAEGFDVSFSDL